MGKVRFLNASFDPLTLDGTVDRIFHHIQSGFHGWLCTVNVSIMMMMRGDSRLQAFVDRASIVVADGQPIIWCTPWFGLPLPERVTGVDLVEAICGRAVQQNIGIYLLGSTTDNVGKLAKRLRDEFPGVNIEFSNGYFSDEEAPLRADHIKASGAKILLVGMGVPRQEIFIEDQLERSGVNMAIGVGGSFDVLAGLRSRAPVWIQKIGMEWLYRLVQEPRRLFKRYLVTNSQFIWMVFTELLRK